MQKITIKIETDAADALVTNFMGEKNPQAGTVTKISDDVDLRYEGTILRRAVDVPSVCYFILGFVTSSLAGDMVVHGAMWLFEKLERLGDRIILKINGRKINISKEAISEAIKLAASEPSIEDQIQNVLLEIEQFSKTIIPLANEKRLSKEKFFKSHPCARLWGAHRFYSAIIESIEPKLEEIKRLENFCIGPIAISKPKENTDTQEPKPLSQKEKP